MIWPWCRKRDEDRQCRFEIRVHLHYRVGALAQLIQIIIARRAIITEFSAESADYRLGLGERYVDLSLNVRDKLHKHSLLAEITAAGFDYQEKSHL